MNEPLSPTDLFAALDKLGIDTSTVPHPPVYTVEEAKNLRGKLPGAHSKSLFLRDKKGHMWLVVVREDRPIDLKDLAQRLTAGRLSFGSPARLMEYLGVIPGAVTPFAVINDTERQVKVVLDQDMLREEPLNFHPLDNTMTTAIRAADLLRFLEETGHDPQIIEF